MNNVGCEKPCRLCHHLVVLIVATIALYCSAGFAQTWQEQFRETNFNEEDLAGQMVRIDGDTVAVGARRDDDIAVDAGAVYIYVRGDGGTLGDLSDDTWLQQAKLYAQ